MTIAPPDGMGLLRGPGQAFTGYLSRYPIDQRTMLHVLRDRATERPDQAWLVFDGVDTLTYGHARDQAHQIAHAVLADAGEGAHVGLLMRNQIEFMPAFYGAMASGGVAVPLNADARGPLLHDVIERSRVRLLVVRDELIEVLERLEGLGDVQRVVVAGTGPRPERLHGVPVVGYDAWHQDHPTDPPRSLPTFSDTAVIQFTSGTTGRQKGAVYPHHFLYLYSAAVSESLGRVEDDVLTTPLPFSHVAATHIVANSAMHAGATAHLKSRFSASGYWEEVAADGATFGIIFGPMAAMIMKAADHAPPHRMRQLFCVPPPPELEAFEKRFDVRIVWQGYGMTEVYPLPMRDDTLPDVPEDTIGYPAQWYDYGVVDEHDRLLPPGDVGELVWRCRLPYGMVTEYFEAPEVTAEVYRNFMFHTGDLAVYDDDGLLHYRGRKSDRIRCRGENVNAAELEFVVLRHPSVLEAAAYGIPSDIGEEDIKLDVVLRDDIATNDLHAWLQDNLPRYMVPRYLERREAFPKTPSERIMKYELRDDPVDRPEVVDFGDRRVPRR